MQRTIRGVVRPACGLAAVRVPSTKLLGRGSPLIRDPLCGIRRPPYLRQSPMNRWNIPAWLELEVIERDRCCVYCRVDFVTPSAPRRERPSWEHIINDARITTRENIARCCIGCNASKGVKSLAAWLESKYCRARGIDRRSVAMVVQIAVARELGELDAA